MTSTFITLSAMVLLACSSAASRCTTACFVCCRVDSMLTSILSINDPCSITKLFNYLYIVDSLFIFLTSSSTFLLFNISFVYSTIYSYIPFIIWRCYYDNSIAVFFVFFSYARIVSKYCFYCCLKFLLIYLISKAKD